MKVSNEHTQNNMLFQPLAARMRPSHIDDFCGQTHLLANDKPLRRAWDAHAVHSMILWGPPGTGKTTLAQLLANRANAAMEKLSAVLSGVKDIRAVVERAQQRQQLHQQATILFIDEIHRFNKSQQDAFLPFVEDGTLTLIGATTENPSFELNNALLSRARVYVLKPLSVDEITKILTQTLADHVNGLGKQGLAIEHYLLEEIAQVADGDARCALNILDIAASLAESDQNAPYRITKQILAQALVDSTRRFDKGGDIFYDQISALHKSVRGSSPDGALYWLARMLDGGCDPLYIARRVTRMASEDIGNADPRALELAINAWDAMHRLGSPEGELALAQAVVYCACAPKSNAVYTAFKAAMDDVKLNGNAEVPIHLRNAPTKLLKELGHGKEYRYDHDEPDAHASGQEYFPDNMAVRCYYRPVERGLEIKIKEKLERLKKLGKLC